MRRAIRTRGIQVAHTRPCLPHANTVGDSTLGGVISTTVVATRPMSTTRSCPPCITIARALAKLARASHRQGVAVFPQFVSVCGVAPDPILAIRVAAMVINQLSIWVALLIKRCPTFAFASRPGVGLTSAVLCTLQHV